ncbi:hypothetical protein EV176_006321, partial [Coemansia sp. RSA 451]
MRANDSPFDNTATPDTNPWIQSQFENQPRSHVHQRIAHRRRAVHDPLMCPSPADVGTLNRAVARRAAHGLLESIDDAVSSPLPRSETFMVGVKADSDVVSQIIDGAVDINSSLPDTRCAVASRSSLEACSHYGLAITQNHDHAVQLLPNPQAIPRLALSSNNYKDTKDRESLCAGVPTSETSCSIPCFNAASKHHLPSTSRSFPLASDVLPQLSMRTIKMIRHRIRPTDTLEGISVQHGIGISDLKRLNRLWQPNEMATRKFLYIPLRMCLPRFTVASIAHVNMQYKEELRR